MIIRSKTSLGDIEIDATLKIMHRVQAQVSTSPLEDGADVADHVRLLPQNVEVVGIIVPTHPSGQVRDLASLAGGLGGFAGVFGFDGTRDIEAWQGLKALIRRRKLIEIVTRYDVYRVLPTELLADEDAGFGLALQFTMRFQQIQIGTVRSSDAIAEDLQDTVGGKVGGDNLGQQTLGGEESVPAGKAKVKPRVANPYTAAYEVAA
jgi:hypothetical protein